MKVQVGKLFIRFLMVCVVVGSIYLFLRLPQFFGAFNRQRSINVLIWPGVIDDKYSVDFEKRTGIKVYMTYFEGYESLLVKMRASGGGDYDLIMASDYALKALLNEGMIKKIDRSKLTFWHNLYPTLLGLSFDPHNDYSIPFSWEVYGIGIDTTSFKNGLPEASWALLFDKRVAPDRVGMLDGARELVSFAAFYLFGRNVTSLTIDQLDQVKKLLIEQKQWVMAYTEQRSNYIVASRSAPVALAISSDIYQAMRGDDAIQFLLPKEGSFMVVDNFMLPAASKKDDFVYEFLNYIYERDRVQEYVKRYLFFPAVAGLDFEDERFELIPTKKLLSRLRFFNYEIPERELHQLWIELKS